MAKGKAVKAGAGGSGASVAPEGSIRFFKDSYQELKKVHPPTREETIRMTIVVVIAMALFAIFLGATDFFIGGIIKNILA